MGWFLDKVKGFGNQLQGRLKQGAAVDTQDPNLDAEGRRDELKGKAQQTLGTAKKKAGDVVQDIGSRIKRTGT